jgi:hypothetical protein
VVEQAQLLEQTEEARQLEAAAAKEARIVAAQAGYISHPNPNPNPSPSPSPNPNPNANLFIIPAVQEAAEVLQVEVDEVARLRAELARARTAP